MNNELQFPYQATLVAEFSYMGITSKGDVSVIFYEDHMEYAESGNATTSMRSEYFTDKGYFQIKHQSILSMTQEGNRICIRLKRPMVLGMKQLVYYIKEGDDITQQYIDYYNSKLKEQPSYQPRAIQKNYYISIALHIILLLFTFGIWQLVWIYKTTDALNNLTREPFRSPVGQLLLCMFIPFYAIYWIYKSAQRIDAGMRARGEHSEFATTAIILAIFIPFLAIILMQDKINHIV